MKFFVLNRKKAESLFCPENHVIISITDPGSSQARLQENPSCQGVLRLQFDDIDQPKHLMICFDADHAEEVLDFVNRFADQDVVVYVHCEAGVSRSAGVAAALSRIFNGEDDFFFRSYIPNRLVYRNILDLWAKTN